MHVLERLEERHLTVDPSRGDDGNLAFEIDEGFEYGLPLLELLPRLERIGVRANRDLSFSVVAKCCRLQHARTPQPRDAREEIRRGPHLDVRGDRNAARRQKSLLTNAMLGDLERFAIRPHADERFGRSSGRGRHVFELEGDDVHTLGKRAYLVEIVVRGDHFDVGNLPGGRIVFRRQRVDAVTQPTRRHGEHATELSAAEYANRGPGTDGSRHHVNGSR